VIHVRRHRFFSGVEPFRLVFDWFIGRRFMVTVGTYEAKTHLAQLLERVAKGEKITITKHGVPVAILQPTDSAKKTPVRDVIDELKRFRSGRCLEGLSVRDLTEEGRR